MTKILWISRYTMTEEQINDLKKIYGLEIKIEHCTKQIFSCQEIYNMAKDHNVVGIVLPIHILGELMDIEKNRECHTQIIHAVSNRVETGKWIINPANGEKEKEYMFSHAYWEEILEAEIKVKRLQ